MMNMYREEEKESYKKEPLKYVKLSLRTSGLNRARLVRRMNKTIKKVSIENTEMLQKIQAVITKYELDSDMYGKALSEETMNLLNKKLEQNQKFVEENMVQV